MMQISLSKLYAAFVAIMVLLPITSFNTKNNDTHEAAKQPSAISKKIKIEKLKIDIQLRQASYSDNLSQTY